MPADSSNGSYSIVIDSGGTNTRIGLADGARLLPDTIHRFTNKEHDGIASVIGAFLDKEGVDCSAACIAIAGPVRDGKGTLTNLDWSVDEDVLKDCTGADVADVLNDLQAQGHAVGSIAEADLRRVVDGEAAEDGAAQLVIGIGTGFNAAPVFHTGDGRVVAPAEAGHVDLPVRSDADMRLARYLEDRRGFADVEEVLSGRGLAQVYDWLAHEDGESVKSESKDIMEALKAGSAPRAEEAVRIFVQMFGRVAGNLALQFLPFGGIYLIGGIARAASEHFDRFDFAGAMRDKGRFSDLVSRFPVTVIEDDYAALAGCAAHLERMKG